MTTQTLAPPTVTDLDSRVRDFFNSHWEDILEFAVDPRRRCIYVVPRSSTSAARLYRTDRSWGSWRVYPTKTIPCDPQGNPDLALLAKTQFVDADLVDKCQSLLPDTNQARAVIREYFEPQPLLWERAEYSATAQAAGPPETDSQSAAAELLPLAYCQGPPLQFRGPHHATLVEALQAQATGVAGITYLEGGREEFESYSELLSAARRVLHGLQRLGLKKGDPLPLQISDRREHFHVFWGCALGGIIPVTIAVPPRYEPDSPVYQKLVGVWKLLGGRHILASANNVTPLRDLLPAEALIHDVAQLDLSGVGEEQALEPSDTLFFQLTSGSTGTPKCIPETHAAVIQHIQHSIQEVGYTPEDRTLNWLPFDHVVPMLTFHLKDVYLGCRAYQVPTAEVLAQPLLWLDLMEKYRIHYSWSPNFGYKLVCVAAQKKQAEQGGAPRSWDLSHLRRLMNAGEQVTPQVCDEFLRITQLSSSVMQPAFGMAEVATCMTYANDYGAPGSVHRIRKSSLSGILQEADASEPDAEVLPLVDLGPPSPGVEIRITHNGSDRVLRERQVGHLQIRGRCVMPGYFQNPEANAQSFVGEGWFDSGDLGFIANGRLVLTGRAKEMIIVRGANFYAYEIEDNVAALPGCLPSFVAATSIYNETTGTEGLVIFFVPDPSMISDLALRNLAEGHVDPALKQLISRIHRQLANGFGVNPDYVIPVSHAGFLKTTSGKIQRNVFKKRFLDGEYRDVCRVLRMSVSKSSHCLPDWFAQPVWQCRNVRHWDGDPQPVPGKEMTVVFDRELVQEHALQNLRNLARGAHLIPSLAHQNSQDGNGGSPPRQTIRLIYARACHASDDDLQTDFCAELLAIGQALKGALWDVELCVVTRSAFAVANTRPGSAARLARTIPLLGITKALPSEVPRIKRAVFLDVDDSIADDPQALADVVTSEMANVSADHEVAIRGGTRYVKRYAPVGEMIAQEIAQAPPDSRYFRANSAYIVTGGLGGIGVDIVRQILEVEGTQVLILGRNTDVHQRLAALHWDQASEQRRVSYAAVDLGADIERLKSCVRQFLGDSSRPLAGVVHLAGEFERIPISDLTAKRFQQNIQAKVWGSIHMHDVLRKLAPAGTRPQFIHFGSLVAVFAGQGLAAYSAACRFQEEFALWQRLHGVDSRIFSWSLWENTGIGARDRALGFAPWVCPISKAQGLAAFEKLVHATRQTDLLVGANLRHPDLARLATNTDRLDYQTLCVFHTPHAPLDVARIRDVAPSAELICLPELPIHDGQVDVEKLRSASLKSLSSFDRGLPSNPHEEQLFQIWKDVLGVSSLTRDDNFFELGGDSLSWSEMALKWTQNLSWDVNPASLMQYGTIAELAQAYATRSSTAPAFAEPKPEDASSLLLPWKRGTQPELAPVFLFPTISGTTSCFQRLLGQVEARRPILGIGDPFLQGDRRSRLLPFEAWMARYADAIQSRQPRGPYTLMSYSQGSTWLWGTAEELLRRGESIQHCILLDPFFPAWNRGQQGFTWLAKWVRETYPYLPHLLMRPIIQHLMSYFLGLNGSMRTEGDRERSLDRAYRRFTNFRENLWLYVLFMELDTGHRVLDRYHELKFYDRQRYANAADFLLSSCAEKLSGQVEMGYLEDVLRTMAYSFLRASTYRPRALPATTEVLVVAPERKGYRLAREIHLDELVARGKLKEVDVPLEPFDKSRHLTGRLRRFYRPFELHYRCMHDPHFIQRCTELLRSLGIAH